MLCNATCDAVPSGSSESRYNGAMVQELPCQVRNWPKRAATVVEPYRSVCHVLYYFDSAASNRAAAGIAAKLVRPNSLFGKSPRVTPIPDLDGKN